MFPGAAAFAVMLQTAQEGPDLISKAMAANLAAIPIAEQDPDRPLFHFRAPSQWMNDPNGPIFYKGWYHLFYQANPYSDQSGPKYWGHARSHDLVNWEILPIAIWPSKSKGEDEIWSGSTHLDGRGRPVAFYTSIGNRDPEQWAARAADPDLIRWTKPDANPVISFKTHAPIRIDEWRDPFLFNEGGSTYLITGGQQEGHGVVTLYQSQTPELTSWKYLGILFHHPTAGDVECPNIVKLGNRWLLLTSWDGHVDWFSGSLDMGRHEFKAEKSGVLAPGSYASQLFTDDRGRCIHIAWMPTSDRHGWNGFLTLPSTLTLDRDGNAVRRAVPELSRLRTHNLNLGSFDLGGHRTLDAPGDLLEIDAEVDPGTASAVRFGFVPGFAVSIDSERREIQIPNVPAAPLPPGPIKLQVFLDRSCLDVYADDGRITASILLPPGRRPDLRLLAEGGTAHFKSLTIYSLKPAQFDLSRFK